MTRRTIRLQVGTLIFDGLDPGDRRRFERAFAAACDAGVRELHPNGSLRERVRTELSLPPGAGPEALAEALARSILGALEER
jgi:hypothetical protein